MEFPILISIGVVAFVAALFYRPAADVSVADAFNLADKNLKKEVTEIWTNFHKIEEVSHALNNKLDKCIERVDTAHDLALKAVEKASEPRHMLVTINRPKREPAALPEPPRILRKPAKRKGA